MTFLCFPSAALGPFQRARGHHDPVLWGTHLDAGSIGIVTANGSGSASCDAAEGSETRYRGGDSCTIEIKRIENYSINKTREYSIDKPLPRSYKQREEMEMALRLNGSPRPCSKGKVLSLNGHSTKKDDPMKSPFSAPIYL
ncbi:hypothetical protein TIFTF001_055537 [Ficus carica]|uniref:Uncharacterized protein n=1 Tax=Ficus carica TaxID=3494 RepID=A0AA88EBV5_FICCA|nr:hypothetical protein TIFTF001_055537 [Ficus carica]